jgi:hypothetical protein
LEFLKDFFHFVLTGRARKFIQKVTAEAAHAEFVKNVDEIIDSQPIPIAPPPPPFIEYTAKLDDPKHLPVYQLSPAQTERLQVSAKVGDVAWSIPQPTPRDEKELADGLNRLNQEIADLKGLGLVRDVSEHFQGKIEKAMKLYGRHVRYYATTEVTLVLFTEWQWVREKDVEVRRERTIQ